MMQVLYSPFSGEVNNNVYMLTQLLQELVVLINASRFPASVELDGLTEKEICTIGIYSQMVGWVG